MAKNSFIKLDINKILCHGEIKEQFISREYIKCTKKKGFDNKVHQEVVNYLLDILPEELEKSKMGKIRKIYILLDIALNFHLNLNNHQLPGNIVIKIKGMEKHFSLFREKHPEVEDDDLIVGIVQNMINAIDNCAPELKDEEELRISQTLQDKIDKYQDYCEKLQKKIEELTKENKKINKEMTKFQAAGTIDSETAKKIKENEEELLKAKQELRKVKQEYKELITKNEELKKKFENLESELDSLRKQLDSIEQEKKEEENIQTKKENLMNLMMELLIQKPIKLDKFLTELKKKADFTNQEFQRALKDLRIKISTQRFVNGTPVIEIDKSFIQSKTINLSESSEFECIFISGIDFNVNYDLKRKILDEIFDYCVTHSIKYIINVGNIYSINLENDTLSNQLKQVDSLTERIIEDYPFHTGITTFTLGGNNETLLTQLGYDALEEIERGRIDLHSLGYKNSSITINNLANRINLVAPTLPTNNLELISKYAKEKKKEDTFMFNVIATTNRSSIDLNTKTILVPPLVNNDLGCSIYHVQFGIQDGDVAVSLISPLNRENKYMTTGKVYSYNNLSSK